MDDSQQWSVKPVPASEVYGRGVAPGAPWTVVFGQPITPDALRRVIGDPLDEG